MPYREGRKWRGSVMVDGTRSTALFPTKGEARRWEEQERKRLKNSKTASKDTDLKRLSVKYLDDVQARYSKKTYDEKLALVLRLGQAWGNPKLAAITPEMVRDYLLDQANARSNNASNRDRKNFLAMWNFARKFLGVSHNPVLAAQLKHSRKPQYTPPEEDIAKLIMAADRTERLFLDCYLQTGARRSEIFRLTWQDINFEAQTMTLLSRKNRRGEWTQETIDMSDSLADGLRWWRKAKENKFRTHTHVWIDHHKGPNYGKPFKVRRKFMAKICERAEVRPFGFHPLRRFVASFLADSGKVSIKRIQELLRHKNLATTERYIKRIGVGDKGTVNLLSEAGKSRVNLRVKRSGE